MSGAVRPMPDFAPHFVRARQSGRCCAECGKAGPHGFELLHTQRVEGPPALAPLLLVSRYPLCKPCKVAAESLGWAALRKVWADLAAAPQSILRHAAMAPTGGAH